MLEGLRQVLNFEWAHGVPIETARAFFAVFFLAVLGVGLSTGRAFAVRGIERPRVWHDLRIWIAAVMSAQAGIYIYFA